MGVRIALRVFLFSLLALLVGFDLPPAVDKATTRPDNPIPPTPAVEEKIPGSTPPDAGSGESRPADSVAQPESVQPPQDPCLSSLYRDWQELSTEEKGKPPLDQYSRGRIIIDRDRFHLTLEGVRRDGSSDQVYETHVALGNPDAPTPLGVFVINHVYCYPDVVFFTENQEKIAALYKGFFAPLLLCDEGGRCDRFHDLGIHGFDASAYPEPASIRPETHGAVSAGCIRLPDPCQFKASLIRLVGVGPIKRNERGTYHWLEKPVEVWIVDETVTLGSLVQEGVQQLGRGLRNLWGLIRR
jgi:hypothetical protein